MSAKVISLDGQQVVFGLDWVPLSGDSSEKKEVRTLVADMDAAFEVRYANDQAIMLGFLAEGDVPDGLSKAAKGKLVSASVLLATFPQITSNAIWIEIDGQNARMAVLKDGLPFPSGDFYGEIGEADERIRQIEADSGITFTFYGNYDAVYSGSIPITLEELVREANVPAASLRKASKGIDVKQIAVLVVLVGLIGYLFLPSFSAAPKKVAAKKQEDPNVVYQAALAGKLAAAGSPVKVSAPALLGDWSVETLQGGWYLSKISCSVPECIYTWSLQGGNFTSLQQALGKQACDFALDGKSATCVVPNAPVKNVALVKANFPTFAEFKARDGSLAQDLSLTGVALTFSVPTIFGVDQAMKINTSALHGAVRSGSVLGKGPVALLKDTLDRLPDSMTIEQMELNTNGIDPQFSFQGTYYVKD